MPTARAVVTDIEGTTTPIAFVRDMLFPYARARLPVFIEEHGSEPDIAAILAEASRLADGRDPLTALIAWMDENAKVTPLKAIQGLIWDQGYREGTLQGQLYPDVAPVLRALHEAGVRLYIYSSGSIASQRLLFAYSTAGDLTPLLDGYFDTTTGGKRDPASYLSIAQAIALPPAETLFLSDIAEELLAARKSGFRTCQIVRSADGTIPGPDFPQASGFTAVDF